MRKSKILQNSKDLISRSFNPSKCKTSLRLAGSRLKLLRNKKEVQIKQMKREIAQLLESGQDQTARIRVEHVVREEKMMAAYDLLEIYCELVVVRLPVIESQKNCPIDLKEAIASLVFSAPRCGDVPELLDAKKQFTAKYGKDFTTAAIELRPQCGVGRMLVEKLSATAPDGQTKIKILTAIAEEHNVKWDPKSFGVENYTSANDLLSGSSSFTKESEQHAEHPRFEPAQVQARPSNNVMHSSPSNFSQQDDRIPVGPEKLVFAQTPGVTTQFQSEAKHPGNERAQEDWNSSSLDNPMGKHRWNMEFKDATSAAQAAAESAERASMAARAAAELASHGRISRQYSTEPHKSNVDILKDEGPKAHPNSELSDASIDKLPSERTRLQNEQINEIKPNDVKIAQKYSQSASSKSKVSADDNSLDHATTVVNVYSRNNSSQDVYNDETKKAEKQPLRYEAETANSWPEKSEKGKKERIGKQHSRKSSGSQSSISDDVNIFSNSNYQKFENESGNYLFVGSDKIGSIDEEAPQTSSHESAAVSFDKYDSDIDDHGFDKGPTSPTYDEQELDFHLSSFGQKSPERLSVDTDSWSRRSSSSKIVNSSSSLFFTKEKSSSDLSENTTLGNNSEFNSAPVMFDESDGPVSESDEDINTRHNKLYDSRDVRKQDEIRQSETGQFSSDDEFSSSLEMKRNQVNIFDTDSPEKLSPVWPSADQQASGPKESKRIDNESDSDSGGRLNFGKLTGGLRHKRHNHLPFVKNRSDASTSSSVKKEIETTDLVKTSIPIEIDTVLDHKKNSRTQYMHSESDSDGGFEEKESSPKNPGGIQALTPVKDVKIKPNSFFGTYNSDSDEDSPNVSLSKKSHVRSGISRRTKASPLASKDESHTKARLRSEALDSDAGIAIKLTTTNSEAPNKPESKRNNSSKWETYERPTSSGAAKSSTWGRLEQPMSAKATSLTKQESEIWLRSEAHDSDTSQGKKPSKSSHSTDNQQEFESIPVKLASKPTKPTSLEPKLEKAKISQKPSIVEEPKAEASIGGENTSSNKDESAKKASHVHPKLPDYDTLFQSLRMNRS